MNEKEIAEIRKRFKPEKSCFGRICGCTVNDKGEIKSRFTQSMGMMPDLENESLLAILKKAISGKRGKTLSEIEFSTGDVTNSPEHKLLMRLKTSKLADSEAVGELFEKIAQTVKTDGSYMILIAQDDYDIPNYGRDGEEREDSDETYSYIICAVCPMKLTKSNLGFRPVDGTFKSIGGDNAISNPILGFLFPAFNDRRTDIYGALFYSKGDECREDFGKAMFNTKIPVSGDSVRETFAGILAEATQDNCNMDVVSGLYGCVNMIEHDRKENRDPEEENMVTSEIICEVLRDCDVSPEKTENFAKAYEREFGAGAKLLPETVFDTKKYEMKTPHVVIRTEPDRFDLVKTEIIDGVKYIMVRAEEGVEVNGIEINTDK